MPGHISDVCSGSWLCKNAKRLNLGDRRNYWSRTAWSPNFASEFNLEIGLENIILVAFQFFEFLHRVVADIVRMEDGVLAEHWDVIQDEATREQSRSGLPMFGDKFPA